MEEEAQLLVGASPSTEDAKVARLLAFFGVRSRTNTKPEFLSSPAWASGSSARCRLFCSSDVFSDLLQRVESIPGGLELWRQRIHSAFVYAGIDRPGLTSVLSRITGNDGEALRTGNSDADEWIISDELDELCGVLSGVTVTLPQHRPAEMLMLDLSQSRATPILASGSEAAFVRFECHGVPVHFSLSPEVLDVEATLTTPNFDVRDHLFSAVPIVLHVKWAFAATCWRAAEVNACLVIDDPLLKPRYGFVDFRKLLGLMERHRFATNIAFIPWNWARSNRSVVELFKSHADKFSVSIHGCDHTAGEFGTGDRQQLRSMASLAVDRMSRHEARTGLRHDRVMVFPQGVFSTAAIEVLKHTSFNAVVNTEVFTTPANGREVTIADVWDVAVMRYGCFPIYTRRYPAQGVENFAFDILLGKPCIVVIHHDFCRENFKHLIPFIERLNALKCRLSWCGLGELVKRSCKERDSSSGAVEMEMYGTELRVQNRSNKHKRFEIRRRETEPSAIKEVRAGSSEMALSFADGYLQLELELAPGDSTTIGIEFQDHPANQQRRERVSTRLKTTMRRYLSEFRDNYVMPAQSHF